MKYLYVIALALMMAACLPEPDSGIGFRLPSGDSERGYKAFTQHGCHSCHTIIGVDTPKHVIPEAVILGGATTRIRTYGDLVTSIINPSHKIFEHTPDSARIEGGESLMASTALNDRLSVTDLVNLVTFLQPTYDVVPPARDPYSNVYR